ncbi:SDR family NAD(P)-dependent oxidoreductase [Dongia deserti]|uniref:SDR family NAD(P)-dependent oxidoreductase n=1 Tax=Dongia deserti TaxID=2268030 RepID=UPI0013C506CA|nr:SDR family oxidoreductase [Dongia deserti]
MTHQADRFSLAGRTTLIIGGSGGLGRAIALGYAGAGARVLVAGRDQSKLDRISRELGAEGAKPPVAYAADVRAPSAIADLAAQVEADHAPVDVLVNCQGTTIIKPAIEVTEAEYDLILDTNLKSVYFACTEFGRRMCERRAGVIINISSLAARSGWAKAAPYCATKWAVTGLTETFAAEWGAFGVRVNAIAPGFFLTDLNRDRMSEDRKAEARRRNAMQRMGEPQELIGAAIYLASPAAQFVSGATLRVDGGYLASGI